MLVSLSIKNFALIDDAHLDLHEGLTIITGETGAGKSILLGALSLLLGKRADLSAVRIPDKKCVVEGVFLLKKYGLKDLFIENELDYEEETILRREILPSGKSRAFINDTPVRLAEMEQLGNRLIDIHSQHETLSLGDSTYQYQVIDGLANNAALLNDFHSKLKSHKALLQEQKQMLAAQKEAATAYDYNLFLLHELQEAKLKIGMQEELEATCQQLNNVEVLKQNLGGALSLLQKEELGSLSTLSEVKKMLGQVSAFSPKYSSLYERISSTLLELDDVVEELENLTGNIEDDPATLTSINDQLQVLYNLQKKHQVDTIEQLLEIQTDLNRKVSVVDNNEAAMKALQAKIDTSFHLLEECGNQLYKKREKAIPGFVSAIEKSIALLGMPAARLRINIQKQTALNDFGMDDMDWQLSANQGSDFQAIKKVASGGELSRIMLAVKSILATYTQLPTIIFDEIDTGISGDIAQKMGGILQDMGKRMQVISITHLPQVAAKGNRHLKVFKAVHDQVTSTHIKELSSENRVLELAEMLGGKENQSSALNHAKALLNE